MEQPVEQADFSERPQDEGLRFARRMYFLRVLGLVLGAVCIGGALWSQGAHALAWAALLANALVWPHIAYPLACRSANPYRAELRNLMVDSASGGAWMAVIGFSPAPSAVIFAMMAMDKVSVGGLRFLARCLAAQAVAAAVMAMALGFEPHPLSSSSLIRSRSGSRLIALRAGCAVRSRRSRRSPASTGCHGCSTAATGSRSSPASSSAAGESGIRRR